MEGEDWVNNWSARCTYTRTMSFRHASVKSVLSIGFAGRNAASAAAPTAPVATAAAPASAKK